MYDKDFEGIPMPGQAVRISFPPQFAFWLGAWMCSISILGIIGPFRYAKPYNAHAVDACTRMTKNARVFPSWGGLHALVHHPRSSFGCAFACVAACFKALGAYFGVVAL